MRKSGRDLMALRISSETAVDLPTPVVPTTAKCRASVSSMAMRASIVVLRELADGDGMAAGEIVHGLQVARADAVRHRTDMRIDGDATVENRQLMLFAVAHFSDQFDADFDGVLRALAPGQIGLADGIDEADCARDAEVDRDHAADRPEVGDRAFLGIGVGSYRRPGAIAAHDMAEDALFAMLGVAPLVHDRLATGNVLSIHLVCPCPPTLHAS